MVAVVATDADDSTDSLYFRGTTSWQWSAAELGWIPAGTTVLNLDLLDCSVLPGSTWILRAAARQRYRGAIVCLNVTVKPAVMGSPTRGRSLMDRPVKAADLVITRLKDISWLYPGRGAEAVARLWLAEGPELVVITCGSDGLIVVRKSGSVLYRATGTQPASVTEFDAAFTGALLGGLHELSEAGVRIEALSTSELASVLDRATATASRSDTQLSRSRDGIRAPLTAAAADGAGPAGCVGLRGSRRRRARRRPPRGKPQPAGGAISGVAPGNGVLGQRPAAPEVRKER